MKSLSLFLIIAIQLTSFAQLHGYLVHKERHGRYSAAVLTVIAAEALLLTWIALTTR